MDWDSDDFFVEKTAYIMMMMVTLVQGYTILMREREEFSFASGFSPLR